MEYRSTHTRLSKIQGGIIALSQYSIVVAPDFSDALVMVRQFKYMGSAGCSPVSDDLRYILAEARVRERFAVLKRYDICVDLRFVTAYSLFLFH